MPGDAKRGLSATAIKLIAAAAMLLDHIAWLWFPVSAAPGYIMHVIGRIAAPVMCFFIAEGYFRTRSVPRYALRLLAFAVISQLPYCYYLSGRVALILPNSTGSYAGSLNVMFTLLLGLLALSALHNRRLPRIARVLLAALCCAATYYCDWPLFGALFIVAFGARHGDRRGQTTMFITVCAVMLASIRLSGGGFAEMYEAGILLALPLLWLYNGRRVNSSARTVHMASKYAFYVFYPLHLLIIALIASAPG